MLRVVGLLVLVGFTIYSLVDCLHCEEERVRTLPKLAWALGIALFPVLGAGAWWVAGRPLPQQPPPRPRPQRRGPIGPDDDPDFLRNL